MDSADLTRATGERSSFREAKLDSANLFLASL